MATHRPRVLQALAPEDTIGGSVWRGGWTLAPWGAYQPASIADAATYGVGDWPYEVLGPDASQGLALYYNPPA